MNSEELKVKSEEYKICVTNFEGITLVALVITIIVLIILAGVSINAVMSDGLIDNAKTAKTRYDEGKINEELELSKLEMDQMGIEFVKNGIAYEYKDEYITGVKMNGSAAETVESFINNFKPNIIVNVYNFDGSEIQNPNTTSVATGMIVKKVNGESEEQIGRIIVYGDIYSTDEGGNPITNCGNGVVDTMDGLAVTKFLEGTINQLEDYQIVAMDVNHDGIVENIDAKAILSFDSNLEDISQNEQAIDVSKLRIKDYVAEVAEYIGKLSKDVQKMFIFNEETKTYTFTGVKSGDTPADWRAPNGVFPSGTTIERFDEEEGDYVRVSNDDPIQTGDIIYSSKLGADGKLGLKVADIVIK